jgi:rare lipoprotein A
MGSKMFEKSVMAGVACAAVAAAASVHAAANSPPQAATQAVAQHAQKGTKSPKTKLDLTGRKRIGKASFYAGKFSGRTTADGTRMNPQNDNAASKTLPLGTTAKVTNLKTGQSAVVTIRDRGPHVQGRIVDLSPSTAEKVGIDRHEGVAKVEVTPITVPLPDGSAKAGEASQDTRPAKLRPGSTSASASTPR